jgi:hypothetical protein
MGGIDFGGVLIANLTAGWFMPAPAFTQWFPHMGPTMTAGALLTVKEQFSGVVYVPTEDISVLPPQWASWTYFDPTHLTLTIYTPVAEGVPQSEIVEPRPVSFKPSPD